MCSGIRLAVIAAWPTSHGCLRTQIIDAVVLRRSRHRLRLTLSMMNRAAGFANELLRDIFTAVNDYVHL